MIKKEKTKGVKSAYVFIPTIILISLLYILTVISTVSVNKYSIDMTKEMNSTGLIVNEIGTIQGTTSKLSETATSFVNTPVIMAPSLRVNEGPLIGYLEEIIDDEKNPDTVKERFKGYKLNDEVLKLINESLEAQISMRLVQSHAIHLIDSISYISVDSKYMDSLSDYDLTEAELSMSDQEKIDLAQKVLQSYDPILNIDYTTLKGKISDNLRMATSIVNIESKTVINNLSSGLKGMRIMLWVSIALILIANFIFFLALIKYLILPIIRFARRIDDNDRLDEKGSLYEANHLAIAYNSLLDRHKEFENELRTTAETDSLTEMPNRYCYNEFLKNVEVSNKPVCVFLLDINNLKYTNDTYGHAKGDDLIKRASACIKECFLDESGKNCYRIGGDEFVAIFDGVEINPEEYVNKFNNTMKKYDVSIAIGYAISTDVSKIGYEKLIIKADEAMYKNKSDMAHINGDGSHKTNIIN